jgi:hypothetical protein
MFESTLSEGAEAESYLRRRMMDVLESMLVSSRKSESNLDLVGAKL